MPLTFVHPVVTVPFRKYGFPLSALIIGSMTPDFNYFLLKEYHIGHTILGQFYFCLPLGIFSILLFHLLLKKPVTELFPESHRNALTQIKSPSLANIRIYPAIIFALLIGSFSHIIWDSFTHVDGYAVTHISLLQAVIVHTTWGELKLYKILQHGSTLVGGFIIVLLYLKWIKNKGRDQQNKSFFSPKTKILLIVSLTAIASIISVMAGLNTTAPLAGLTSFKTFVGTVIRTFIPVFSFLLTLYSCIWTTYQKYSIK